ncbi:NADH dehydrogenase (ubiquinone) 24 kDa subunit [Methanobacterium lacus]|jgi:NADH-quinone oxidoreductase subunit E|uniref:NADH dehydrogenase (Ubiquinone) 24 kDa subunit n=1 Tax=Methanobacterium lacus (strain AL-21) TaxID=877455 RepID=F0T7Q0_METLA|nr:NADH-quinone oxidoreductase subunit NuoE [Methanobacterium lacus]ADZ10732.1 NADH dehydrogenase (ubiquinone) 24 kDa subunit [Methanobacterium lacus]
MTKTLNEILSTYEGTKSELIPLLQDVQANLGYLSEESIKDVSKFTGVSESEIYGVATFYTQFRFTPVGKKHIMVCKGTACHVKGAPQIIEGIERHLGIKEGEVTFDMEYSLESVGCLGCCALAPCAMINDDVESNMTLKDVKKIFRRIERQSKSDGEN